MYLLRRTNGFFTSGPRRDPVRTNLWRERSSDPPPLPSPHAHFPAVADRADGASGEDGRTGWQPAEPPLTPRVDPGSSSESQGFECDLWTGPTGLPKRERQQCSERLLLIDCCKAVQTEWLSVTYTAPAVTETPQGLRCWSAQRGPRITHRQSVLPVRLSVRLLFFHFHLNSS